MSRKKVNRANKALVRWGEITEEIETLMREYEDAGWETLILHPGDVAPRPVDGEREAEFGLVVPDSELDALAKLVENCDGTYNEFEVHHAATEALEMFAVVMKAVELEHAVCYPVYYDPETDVRFVDDLRESDTIYTTITNLGESQIFSFSHKNPKLFVQ